MRKSSLSRKDRKALTIQNKADRKERQGLGIKGSTLGSRKDKMLDHLWRLGHTFDQQPKHIF